ncbi:MAG TPA: patatin-like phospholipase family protein, partial [Xanthobacteraceae bacterium]
GFALHRRDMVLGTAAAFLSTDGASSGDTGPHSAQPDLGINAQPAAPIPAAPSLGMGKDRALVLGGGGEYFIAWLLGFARGLRSMGVSYELADVIVGTSAGAVVGSMVAVGHLGLLRDDIDFFGVFPKLLADLIPASASHPSQVRARHLAEAARDASVATIQSIGRGAMAAHNPPVRNIQLMIDALSPGSSWPSPRFHATTTDCYTAERLVLSQSSNVPISHAVCASVSLPGVFGPTWIDDRLCMDGAMCSTSTHVDLIAGAKCALVVALTDKGLRFSSIPNDIEQELSYVEAAGTKTLLIAADPGKVHLLSPAEIEPALKAGYDRAAREADRVKALWA